MYPFLRMAKEILRARAMPPLELGQTHETFHLCWPHDLDFQLEMNNGRILSIFDLGRVALGARIGLLSLLRREGWGLAVAGVSVRYRRRIPGFARFRVTSRAVGRDARFVYITQTLWLKGEAAANMLCRIAITEKGRMIPTDRIGAALGQPDWSPDLPDWILAWTEAEAMRPWPPEA